MMTTSVQLLTADDLWNRPDDGNRHELVRGEIRTMAPAGFEHGDIGMTIGVLLAGYLRGKSLGRVVGADTGFILSRDPDTVRAPDCAFVSAERLQGRDLPKKFFPGAPDLAVEVISPSDKAEELEEKTADYFQAGTKLVWIINPRLRTVTVRRPDDTAVILRESDTITADDLIPGFACQIREIFE